MDQSPGTLVKHAETFGIHGFNPGRDRDIVRQMEGTAPAISEFDAAIVNTLPEGEGRMGDAHILMPDEKTTLKYAIEDHDTIFMAKLIRTDKGAEEANKLLAHPDDLQAFENDLQTLVSIGAHVVKIRLTFQAGMPDNLIAKGCEQFGFFHNRLAKNGKVMGIYEPEVLFDNYKDLQANLELEEKVLAGIKQEILNSQNPDYPHGWKISYVVPGKNSEDLIFPDESARATKEVVENAGIDPEETPVVHLSGGIPATAVREIHSQLVQIGALHGTSYSRAHLEKVYKAGLADIENPNFKAGHDELMRQITITLLAQQGKYDEWMEEAPIEKLRAAA